MDKGFTQVERIDYKEMFSPVVKFLSIKFLVAMEVNDDQGLLHLMNVKTTF